MTSAADVKRGPTSAAHVRPPGKSTGPRHGAPSTASAVKVAGGLVAPLVVALAVLGGIGSFGTVHELAKPWFGRWAWIVPVGVDVGILVLLAWDLLMEYLDLPWPVLRWVAWAFIAATVYLNVAAAGGDLVGAVMHAAMPTLFVTVIEGVRHLIRRWVGLATAARVGRVPLSRRLLAPASSFLLWRRMVLWHVTGYRDGLQLEYQRLLVISQLKETYGRWLWRWRAPLRERLALRLLPAAETLDPAAALSVETAAGVAAIGTSAASRPSRLEAPRRPSMARRGRRSGRADPVLDPSLVQAARTMVADAEHRGMRLSQAGLADQLRAQGFSVANGRLRGLAAATGLNETRIRKEEAS